MVHRCNFSAWILQTCALPLTGPTLVLLFGHRIVDVKQYPYWWRNLSQRKARPFYRVISLPLYWHGRFIQEPEVKNGVITVTLSFIFS